MGSNMKRLVLAILCGWLPSLAAPARAQTLLWSKVYDSSRPDNIGQDVATDRDGNVHTVGTPGGQSSPSNTKPSDVYLAKFDGHGQKMWSHDAPGTAVAVDKNGNVFVVGTTTESPDGIKNHGESDISLTKYGRDGKRLWLRLIGTAAADYASDVAVDGGGNVYLAGGTQGSFTKQTSKQDYDACLIKVDSDGNTLWVKSWGSPGFHDVGRGVGTDAAGNVYFSGDFERPIDGQARAGTQPLYSMKLDASGNEKSKHVVSGDAGAVLNQINDESGNFYVVARSLSSSLVQSEDESVHITKFNASWKEQWTRTWAAAGVKKLRPIAVDGAGSVYVAGALEQEKDGVTSASLVILKYSREGVLLWEHLKKAGRSDAANGIAVDAAANVFLTGVTGGRFGEDSKTTYNIFLLKYSQDSPASFDCKKATTVQEKLICQSARLSTLDHSIARLYEAQVGRAKDKARVKADQSRWLKTVRDAGTTSQQLEASMSARLDALKSGLQAR